MSIQGMIGEDVAVLATVDPQDAATSAVTSDWVDVAKYPKISGLVAAGAITGTIDFKLQQATDTSGTSAKDITGASITQLSATDDNKQAWVNLEVDAGNLDLANGFHFMACIVTPTGGTTNLAFAALLGAQARYKPVAGHDLASVAEIVNV
jgi:hypothetical protein